MIQGRCAAAFLENAELIGYGVLPGAAGLCQAEYFVLREKGKRPALCLR